MLYLENYRKDQERQRSGYGDSMFKLKYPYDTMSGGSLFCEFLDRVEGRVQVAKFAGPT